VLLTFEVERTSFLFFLADICWIPSILAWQRV